jgi:hypothetical protein
MLFLGGNWRERRGEDTFLPSTHKLLRFVQKFEDWELALEPLPVPLVAAVKKIKLIKFFF